VTLAEKAILPYAFALYFTGVNAARVNGRPPSEWLANGQCLLVKKEAYEIMGGHKAVLDSVIEDVALARLAARKGVRTRVVRAEHMGTVRMYDSLGAIFRGFEKNSFRFLRINPATGGFVIVSSILLTTWLPVLMWLLWAHLYRQAAIFAVIPSLILLPWYRGASALLAPVAIYLFQGIALSAMWKNLTGRKTEWKGRAV
jgi:chlorobactene glucosyltransferase